MEQREAGRRVLPQRCEPRGKIEARRLSDHEGRQAADSV
jgi:hypothetical protein